MSHSAQGFCDVGRICSWLSYATRDMSDLLWTSVNSTSISRRVPSANILCKVADLVLNRLIAASGMLSCQENF